MSKRQKICHGCEHNKEGEYDAKDWINQLPDDVLVSLLGSLTLKEAAATCVLSKRWRNLWKSMSRLEVMDVDATGSRLFRREPALRPKFVDWVNQGMASLNSQNLEVFRLSFDLDETCKNVVDEWIKFAFQRRVQRFELDLSNTDGAEYLGLGELYTLSYELFLPSKRSSFNSTSIDLLSLRALCLKGVNVTDDVLHFFLSECPLLERLSVYGSKTLVNVKVVGQTLMLKFLEICFCKKLQSIEIYDANIVNFMYRGRKVRMLLENVPKLIHLTIGGMFCSRLADALPCFSSRLPMLRTLIIDLPDLQGFRKFRVCELTKLKTLVLIAPTAIHIGILGCTCFIKAAPFLRKLVLQVEYSSQDNKVCDIMRKAAIWHHQYLEELEFRGFSGGEGDLYLVTFFLKNAIPLKKIVIDPRAAGWKHLVGIEYGEEVARKIAEEQLKPRLPSGVQLVIL